MPMMYTLDHDTGLVRITGSGRLTDDDMVTCIECLRADPGLEPDMSTLSDMRGVDMALTPRGIEQMLAVMRRTADRRHSAKAAIVVDTDLAFGFGRMFELRAEDQTEPRFRIFRDMDAAEEWLGLTESGA